MESTTTPQVKKEECKKTFAYYVAIVFLVLGLLLFIFSGSLIFIMRKEGEDIDTMIYVGFLVSLGLIGACSYGVYQEEKKRKETCKN